MDAVERAVHTLHVLSSALGRIGSRFFLCVTVRFSERIAARSLFTEYGEYVGAGALTAAYIAERAETFIPNAAARMTRYFLRLVGFADEPLTVKVPMLLRLYLQCPYPRRWRKESWCRCGRVPL